MHVVPVHVIRITPYSGGYSSGPSDVMIRYTDKMGKAKIAF